MLFSIIPRAYVLFPVGPDEFPVSVFFVVEILSVVASTVGPGELTGAMHFIAFPQADVNPPV